MVSIFKKVLSEDSYSNLLVVRERNFELKTVIENS